MSQIKNILFPVDFSDSSVAMAPYVRRAATIFDASVSLIHVFDPVSYNGFELYIRREVEIARDHETIARGRIADFLRDEFPASEYPRIVVSGDAASQIAAVARDGFDLIIMPTHAGRFRRMLLGSTTAKVLDDADCPVLTSKHALEIAPRPLQHRESLCAIGLDDDSERVLRFAHQTAAQGGSHLQIIHAIQSSGPAVAIQLDLNERIESEERQLARERIEDLQRKIGFHAPIHIVVGPIKKALLDAVRQYDADALIIGRAPRSGEEGRMRDLTYAMIRESPFPVWSV